MIGVAVVRNQYESLVQPLVTWLVDHGVVFQYGTEVTDVGSTPLQEGDALLLYGPGAQTRSYDPRPGLLWLHKPHQEEAPRKLRHLGKWAALIMAGVIALAGFNLLLPQSLHRAAVAVIYHHRGFI